MILQDGFLSSSPYRHFERSREIFLAHRRSCRMALLVCIFSMRSHTHHFSFCYEDPSASLGMTPWEKRQLSSVGAILPLKGGAPEGRRLASRMFDYPYPRIIISSKVEKSFLHVDVFAGWLYWFASFPCDLTLTFFSSAIKIPRLRSG